CPITPSSGSGTETVAFTLTIFNAEMQQYHFDLNAGMISLSGSTNSEVSGSISKSDFYVTVTNQQPTFTITIAAPPPVAVTIDGSVQTPGPVTVTESPGLHTISVPQTIPVTNGMKLDFSHWSDGSYQAARSIDIEDD